MNSSHSQKQSSINETYISEPAERRGNALQTVSLLCENIHLQPHLHELLSAKDSHGQTPFMLAVTSRSYQAGIIILNAILKIANNDDKLRDSMIFPEGSISDQSPLHVLCCNDTCSFTWTGADHINQDIFECRTCGLTGSLCCCTECAKVCHKGHDCKLKRTSPTAYCDCWEKCKCKTLIAGNQQKRFELLCKITTDTDLVTRFNSRGESILLFLIQTVGRQSVEQRQYRSSRIRNSTAPGGNGAGTSGGGGGNSGISGNNVNNASSAIRNKTPSLDIENDMPEHDLEPPRFATKALEYLLKDWLAVKSMILTGTELEKKIETQKNQVFYEDHDNQKLYLQSQSGTTLLDKFTHSLFVRCSHEPLDNLLSTLVRELQNSAVTGRIEEAQIIARRFVRSVVRVFVIFSIERANNSDKQRNSQTQTRHLAAYRTVFTSLMRFAIEELVEIADALITPVRMGVVRPTAAFALSSSSNLDPLSNADDLFSVEPLAPSSTNPSSLLSRGSHVSNLLNINNNGVGLESGIVGDGNRQQSSRLVDSARNSAAGFISRINVRLEIEEPNDTDGSNMGVGPDDGDISEQEELVEQATIRQNNRNTIVVSGNNSVVNVGSGNNGGGNNGSAMDDDVQDPLRNDDVQQEGESDTEFNFQEAETESDSDDNQSTQDAQRSVQTGATAGSDTGEV